MNTLRICWSLALAVIASTSNFAWQSAAWSQQKALPEAQTQSATFSLATDREALVSLQGKWRFQPGDDPKYSNPAFDDSQWKLLDSTRPWSEQGYKGMSGLAWYRFRIEIPANSPQLSLYIPRLLTSYQVYVDGRLIGQVGGMPPRQRPVHMTPQVFRLPKGSDSARTVTIAIRVWHWPYWVSYYGGGPVGSALLGDTALIQQRFKAGIVEKAWGSVDTILIVALEGLAGFASLGLFLLRRREREYLWFSLMLLCQVADNCFAVWAANRGVDVFLRDVMKYTLWSLLLLSAIAFYFEFLHGRRNWFFWLTVTCAVSEAFVAPFLVYGLHTVKPVGLNFILITLENSLWILFLLADAARKGLRDARLLLIPVGLQRGAVILYGILDLSYDAGWQHSYPHGDTQLGNWPFNYTLGDLADALFLVAMLAILINRFTRTRREEERFASELEAARTLQQVMIPEALPSIPGLTIETAYFPAQEVGGDFFQIVPLASGDTLIVLGDVSGKGLGAAMTVSLIVGALRTLMEISDSPAAILAGLNRRLHGRGSGFTTCIALRIGADGVLTLANAGHLAPYLNGSEIQTEAALPLGLDPQTSFQETTVRLAREARLTLLTDGVPEAGSNDQLFGFARTEEISIRSANEIANTARSFGQTDDITVLTLSFPGFIA